MKNKKHSIYSVLAVFITVIIIVTGTVFIFLIKNLLPNHKEEAVFVNMPSGSGLYFAQQSTDITLSYPWDMISEETEYISDSPSAELADANMIFTSIFSKEPTDTDITYSYATVDSITYLRSSYSNAQDGYDKSIDIAFEDEGRLISFNISRLADDNVDSDAINSVYKFIEESANSNQATDANLVFPLDELTSGVAVNPEEYVYNKSLGKYESIDTSSLSFFEKDPISDFFRKYCIFCSENGLSGKDAQHIYTLLRYGSYGCIYSNGQIYLTYSITDFGTLTLVWDVASTELCAMAVDARDANPDNGK